MLLVPVIKERNPLSENKSDDEKIKELENRVAELEEIVKTIPVNGG
jgi:hypothetical protein